MIFLLLLPGMEVYTLFRFFESAPLAAGFYLLAATALGWLMMRAAKVGLAETIRRLTQQGGRPGALLVFGKLWAMGALLFFPGYITDCMALFLLLLPGGLFGGNDEGENKTDSKRMGGRRIVDVEGREDSESGH